MQVATSLASASTRSETDLKETCLLYIYIHVLGVARQVSNNEAEATVSSKRSYYMQRHRAWTRQGGFSHLRAREASLKNPPSDFEGYLACHGLQPSSDGLQACQFFRSSQSVLPAH